MMSWAPPTSTLPTPDLPKLVVRSIVRQARPRHVPGTNPYALVCRTWRDASNNNEDEEQLNLLLDLDNLSEADLATSLAWLQRHGSCVTGLSISGVLKPCWSVMEQLVLSPVSSCSQLTRLELQGRDTLPTLAPHLPRLPCLQHLGASITATEMQQGIATFTWASGEFVEAVPDLLQLCPQLVSMHLTIRGGRVLFPAFMDLRLPRLLPVSLRELRLTADDLSIHCAQLAQLTLVERITLEVGRILGVRELISLSSLQQVALWSFSLQGMDLPSLASKLVGVICTSYPDNIHLAELRHLTSLTALRLDEHGSTQDLQGTRPLAGLASLRHLMLDTRSGDGLTLEDVPSIGSLRSLELVGFFESSFKPEAVDALGRATQLTSLAVAACGPGSLPAPRKAWLLQQLTGLQRLHIDQGWFAACSDVLGTLPHLRQLGVIQSTEYDAPPLQLQGLVDTLQRRPDSLRHLVFVCQRPDVGHLSGHQLPPQEVVPSPLPGVRVTVTSHGRPLESAELQKRPLCNGLQMCGLWEVVSQV